MTFYLTCKSAGTSSFHVLTAWDEFQKWPLVNCNKLLPVIICSSHWYKVFIRFHPYVCIERLSNNLRIAFRYFTLISNGERYEDVPNKNYLLSLQINYSRVFLLFYAVTAISPQPFCIKRARTYRYWSIAKRLNMSRYSLCCKFMVVYVIVYLFPD